MDAVVSDRSAFFTNVIAMAPMAVGGNLPYRRLCREYGADLTCSEMVLADKLVKGGEGPLLRSHPSEDTFGVQLCGKHADTLCAAAQLAVERGAHFVDLNFGCPIDLVVQRGAGSALLKKPARLAALVAAVREAVTVPLSVKIRTGYSEDRQNAAQIAPLVEAAGADALVLHGRTRQQRYKRSANWEIIAEVASSLTIPVIGNGDVLTPWDLARRRAETPVRSFLIARGCLIKPWVFRELRDGEPWFPTVAQRWAVMRRYLDFALEYFGDDDKGQQRAHRFLIWHLGFWHRWRPYTEDDFRDHLPESLIQRRDEGVPGAEDPEAALLASDAEEDHERIWRRLLDRDFPVA